VTPPAGLAIGLTLHWTETAQRAALLSGEWTPLSQRADRGIAPPRQLLLERGPHRTHEAAKAACAARRGELCAPNELLLAPADACVCGWTNGGAPSTEAQTEQRWVGFRANGERWCGGRENVTAGTLVQCGADTVWSSGTGYAAYCCRAAGGGATDDEGQPGRARDVAQEETEDDDAETPDRRRRVGVRRRGQDGRGRGELGGRGGLGSGLDGRGGRGGRGGGKRGQGENEEEEVIKVGGGGGGGGEEAGEIDPQARGDVGQQPDLLERGGARMLSAMLRPGRRYVLELSFYALTARAEAPCGFGLEWAVTPHYALKQLLQTRRAAAAAARAQRAASPARAPPAREVVGVASCPHGKPNLPVMPSGVLGGTRAQQRSFNGGRGGPKKRRRGLPWLHHATPLGLGVGLLSPLRSDRAAPPIYCFGQAARGEPAASLVVLSSDFSVESPVRLRAEVPPPPPLPWGYARCACAACPLRVHCLCELHHRVRCTWTSWQVGYSFTVGAILWLHLLRWATPSLWGR
jgi:hypothetical protein